MIVCVLGMHKSGTTLVAEMLHHSGIHMADVDPELGYDESNKYERHEAQDINRDLLRGATIPTWRSLRSRNAGRNRAGYQSNTDSVSIVRRAKLVAAVRDADLGPMRELATELTSTHRDWGFKDPRTCLTYDAWRRALPDHRLIGVHRSFDEVLTRYKAAWSSPVRTARIVRSWIVHNEMLIEHLRRRDDFVLVRYATLMSGPDELERLRDYLGHRLVDRRKPDLYRARVDPSGGPSPPTWIPRQIYARAARIDRALAELGQR